MVVNICFEGLKEIICLNRVWEYILKAGRNRNERVKVSSDSGSFTRRGLLADLERPAEMWWGQIAERAGGTTLERRR